jgi:SAM-dependent methyltransferase
MAEHLLARLKTAGGGAPVHKKSDALTESQAKRHAVEVFPAVLAMLAKHGCTHVLDLSCGAGDLLMHLAQHTKNIVGVGIGMDGPAVRRANQAITRMGLEKRLIAVTANPADVCLETQRTFDRIGISRQLWDEIDCLIAPQLFSELLARESPTPDGGLPSGSIVVRMLSSIPKKFPNAHLLVIEATASDRFDKNYYAPELSLLMRLSKTTPWPAEKWRDLFEQARLQVIDDTGLTTDGLTLFLCRPART